MGIFSKKWAFYISGLVLIFATFLGLFMLDDVLGMGDGLNSLSEYYQTSLETENFSHRISFDYTLGIIIGIAFGAFFASVFSRNFKVQFLAKFDNGITIRTFKTIFYGIVGGFLIMSGAQIAGESILGQLVSAIQMSSGAWIFLISLALSGGILAILLDNGGKSSKEND